ncbi:MAG: hypothetical protein DWI02_03145 [Planctomycetota bacterium]|nr:MAG: hypothetical protein DWI02_03145 [Planctomycetota bacterium]
MIFAITDWDKRILVDLEDFSWRDLVRQPFSAEFASKDPNRMPIFRLWTGNDKSNGREILNCWREPATRIAPC